MVKKRVIKNWHLIDKFETKKIVISVSLIKPKTNLFSITFH